MKTLDLVTLTSVTGGSDFCYFESSWYRIEVQVSVVLSNRLSHSKAFYLHSQLCFFMHMTCMGTLTP